MRKTIRKFATGNSKFIKISEKNNYEVSKVFKKLYFENIEKNL